MVVHVPALAVEAHDPHAGIVIVAVKGHCDGVPGEDVSECVTVRRGAKAGAAIQGADFATVKVFYATNRAVAGLRMISPYYSATSQSLLKNGIPTERWLRSTSTGGIAREHRVSYKRHFHSDQWKRTAILFGSSGKVRELPRRGH